MPSKSTGESKPSPRHYHKAETTLLLPTVLCAKTWSLSHQSLAPACTTSPLNAAWIRHLQVPPSPTGLQVEHLSQTFVALWSHPAFQAGLVAILVAGVVSEEVVSGPAELVAAEAVVMLCARHADLVLEVGNPHVVLQGLPLPAGVDHARVGRLLDNAIGAWGAREMSEVKLPLGPVINSHITALWLHRQGSLRQLVGFINFLF